MKKLLIILTTLLLLIACGGNKKQIATAEPYVLRQTLFHNGDIITMEGEEPQYVEAVVQQEGKIVFVGDLKTAEKKYPNATKKNLHGKTMLPGFVDGHGHFVSAGQTTLFANVMPPPDGPGKNFDELVQTVKDWMETDNGKFIIQKYGWVVANGYDDSQLDEKTHPTKEVLDKITTEYPVIFMHQSGHLAAFNSKGIEASGYTKDTPDPKGGHIQREDDGSPNGVLEEEAYFQFFLPINTAKTDDEVKKKSVLAALKLYASNGYTTVQDGRSTPDQTGALENAAEANELYLDVVAYPDIVWNQQAAEGKYYKADHTYYNHYRVGGVKLSLDGSPQGKTAWLTKPYFHPPHGQHADYRGFPQHTDEEVEEYVKTAYKNHWQILCHNNGDAAMDQYINAVEAAQKEFGYDDPRTVIIHGQTMRKDQVQRVAKNRLFVSYYPSHTFYWGDWHLESVLGHPRADYISPCRDAIDAGINITSHHDAPVIPPSSMRVLDAPVNRVTRSGYVLGPNQRITVYEGLQALTIWAANQYFEENSKGTLSVGKLADFVILDQNPLKVAPLTIHTIKINETIKEGEPVYKAM
ncbi:amidohydrolase [Tenacibaculum sp. UWU-22]|uniref:amidohydrolase n=1 Tax=Tenacibaculum sp. UWU-22 TaxID=3234187 RepID=UPI0034DB4D7A